MTDLGAAKAMPWWRVELRGAHLLWWLAFLYWMGRMVGLWRGPLGVEVYVFSFLLGMWVFKVMVPVWFVGQWLTFSPEERTARWRGVKQYYRWWATGWPPVVIALAVGVIVGTVLLLGSGLASPHR